MKLGFIGTGAITEALIVGLIEVAEHHEPIFISARSASRSANLANRFSNVSVETENQAIVDKASIVFVSVLPDQAIDVLKKLQFREDQVIVSVIAGLAVDDIRSAVVPAQRIHRVIPMPPIEMGVGPIPLYPPSPEIEGLLGRIGTMVPVEDEKLFSGFMSSSALMGIFFELVATNARWLESQGVPDDSSAMYSTALFQSLARLLQQQTSAELQTISRDCLTAGGLNEQVLFHAWETGWFKMVESELDKVLLRVQ